MLGPLVDGERGKQRTVGYFWQVFRFLRSTAGAQQRGTGEHGRRKKRRRHQVAADFLHHHAGFDTTETAATELLRHQQTGKSHLGESLPEVAGKARSIVAVAELAQMRHRRFVADETARAVAQHRLFFAKDECHWRVPIWKEFRSK